MSVISNNILAGSSGQGGGGYAIERSLRFNSADSAYLNRTPSSAGNRKTWTWSGWVKRSSTGVKHHLFAVHGSSDNSGYFRLAFETDGTLFVGLWSKSILTTVATFRDFSAWYHVVLVLDNTNSTEADRIILYVNGVRQSVTGTADSNTDYAINSTQSHNIGWQTGTSQYFDGYMADIHFIDGQALAAADFGEYDDNNVWQPKEYAGTYGTNGFKLDFSDTSSASALGTDSSGQGNDWSVNNLTGPNGINYVNAVTAAVSGSVPNGGTPYWVDIIPTNADLDIDLENNLDKVFDGSTATNAYWVGDQYDRGNVTRARFDLRDFPTITSLRVYSGFDASTYIRYDYQLLDNSKSAIAGTSGSFGPVAWHTIPLAGTPRYLEFSCTSGNRRRNRLYAIEVNGTILVNSTATTDALRDSPVNGDSANDTGAGGEITGNYATWNPLAVTASGRTYSDGNLKCVTGTAEYRIIVPTIYYPTGYGKWYCEITVENLTADTVIGAIYASAINGAVDQAPGYVTNSVCYQFNGNKVQNSSSSAYGASYTDGDIIGVAFDAENGSITFYKNGVSQGVAFSSLSTVDQWALAASDFDNTASGTGTYVLNAGQRAFAYTAPSGYKALCTANLPDPTIADGSTAFDTKLYTGNNSTQTISGLNFSPDLVWIKNRAAADNHKLLDTVRGATNELESNTTDAEVANADGLTAFNSDGFDLGADVEYNTSSEAYVAWTWDAGSSTVTNTDGSISAQVRANPSAGFSIVSYTGDDAASGTIGHGLNAAPKFIIIKSRNVADFWPVYHHSLGTNHIKLNDSAASGVDLFGSQPTSSVFSVGTGNEMNGAYDYIAYCFAPVDGYSAFGSYTGNGSADGPFVFTGFNVNFLLLKAATVSGSWFIQDLKRGTTSILFGQLTNQETTLATAYTLSNGFKVNGGTFNYINGSGQTYIWAAFASHPFKTSRAR